MPDIEREIVATKAYVRVLVKMEKVRLMFEAAEVPLPEPLVRVYGYKAEALSAAPERPE